MIGSQRWSVGHTMFTVRTSPTSAELSTYADGLLAAFKTNVWNGTTPGKLAVYNSTQTNVDSVRAYFYPTGSSVASVVGVSTGAAAAGSQSSGVAGAPQLSIVATLENGNAGRQNRGRMYLPVVAPAIQFTTLQLSGSDATAWATSVANYLSAARTVAFGDEAFTVPIVSELTATTPITAVSVDTVMDTQRRRRDKIIGTRSRATLVVG